MSSVTGVVYKGTSSPLEVTFSQSTVVCARLRERNCDKTTRRRRKRKRYNTRCSFLRNAFHHRLDCIFCIMCRKMAERYSKRVKHEEPDVVSTEFECFVCHLRCQPCETSVQLPCCRQYVHRHCQLGWEEYHNTCGLCRASLSGCNDTSPAPSQTNWSSDDDADAAAAPARAEILTNRPHVDTDRIANDVLT